MRGWPITWEANAQTAGKLSRRALRSSAMCYGQVAVHLAARREHPPPARFRQAGRTGLGCARRRGTSLDRVMSSPLAASTIDRVQSVQPGALREGPGVVARGGSSLWRRGGDSVRVAIIYRPRSAAPIEALPMLMGALGQWVENYSKRFSTLEFFVIGGGLVLADIDDSAELNRIVAENPFTPFMDVEIMPVVEPGTAMATYGGVVAAFAAPAQPSN